MSNILLFLWLIENHKYIHNIHKNIHNVHKYIHSIQENIHNIHENIHNIHENDDKFAGYTWLDPSASDILLFRLCDELSEFPGLLITQDP